MFRSRVVAHWNPSNLRSRSWMFGNRKEYLLILLLKSDRNMTLSSFFGIMKQGVAHWLWLTFLSTPMFTRRSTYSFSGFSYTCGILYGFPWYGFTSSFRCMVCGSPFHCRSDPSKIFMFGEQFVKLCLFFVAIVATTGTLQYNSAVHWLG